MQLLTLSREHLFSQSRLPFDIVDRDGKLLLPAFKALDEQAVRAKLLAFGEVYGEARRVEAWRRSLAQTVDALVRRNAPLAVIARAQAMAVQSPAGNDAAVTAETDADAWEQLQSQLDVALRDAAPGQPWLHRVLQLHARASALGRSRLDEALFHFFHSGARHAEQYSSHQALRCMLAVGAMGRELGWDAGQVQVMELAALTMNVTVHRLQDRLARTHVGPLDRTLRARIARHGEDAAALLQASGVSDPVWLEAVRLHQDASLEALPEAALRPGQRMARLLRRVDVYCAKLSCRADRAALSPLQAAKQVCLGPDGRPDRLGAVLLKALGLYPPGSFVLLDSDEVGIVLSRGARADQPLAAALVNAQGEGLLEPRLRDTARLGLRVRAALRADQVAVQPSRKQFKVLHQASRAAFAPAGRRLMAMA